METVNKRETGSIGWHRLDPEAASKKLLPSDEGLTSDEVRRRTKVFTALCLSQMGRVLAIRSERESFFRQEVFPANRSSGPSCRPSLSRRPPSACLF